jgi:saccharopine dehydrogenase-like NADP-dependent oxidoreductase
LGTTTEYLKDTIVLRDYVKTKVPLLSERVLIIINGRTYEEDFTASGVANLPYALFGRVRSLDYKTFRFEAHYVWIDKQLTILKKSTNKIAALKQKKQAQMPNIEKDQVMLYAAVEGKDKEGVLRCREVSKCIVSQKVGTDQLRGIQTKTAEPLVQAAHLLLEYLQKGVIF